MSIHSSDIQLKVRDKTVNAYLASGVNGSPGILLLHAWWGLKPFFKEVCDQLAEQGFSVLAPDLYQGRIAATIEEAEKIMGQRDSELMGDIVKAAKDHLISLRKGKPIGVLGFSMGAAWSLVVAAKEPDVSAVVLFYGGGDVDFNSVKAKVLGHFAEMDEWEPLEGIRAMETGMKAAGVEVTLNTYPKAGHWFVERDRPEYDSSAALLAWSRTFEFLRKNL
ncbi:MAG: dienelactone hydrolase family protein [Chloroflexi bacterium]|nr:dienelactone hydrolase family protein [Chloroflexota bacterium]